MKRIVFAFVALAMAVAATSCDKKEEQPVEIKVQLSLDGAAYAAQDVAIAVVDAAGTASFEEKTNASGIATFVVPSGLYKASASFKNAADGVLKTFTGSADFQVVAATPATVDLKLNKVEASQIIIKEFYSQQCPKNDGSTFYGNDAYVTIYNNSELEADASELVFGVVQPGNAQATNKYYTAEGVLSYTDYVPAYSGIWYFQTPVKIAPYSSLTIAFFGAIDHTATVTASVDLSKPEYYVMSKDGVSQITNSKYQIAETISKDHYLTAKMFNMGNSWVLSNSAPAFFVGKMSLSELTALIDNTDAYDLTGGKDNIGWAPKFPVANIVDAVECWDKAQIAKSSLRFPSSVNSDYLAITIKKGHTYYRNVDKEATEALAENAGKLVYGYADGTADIDGSTDPSGIDAEASMKAGCHIIFSDTNSTSKDFHERKESSLRK
ncbi:MAG: DUF4876 domain-containing protein [Bacteroidales bacterium]|nr:DUF4876 domain-containing protein [Candidatus Cryptobacteroides faecihippi]